MSASLDELFQSVCLRLYGKEVMGKSYWSVVRPKLDHISRSVGQLSRLYTRNRDELHRTLLQSPELREGYFWYFLPANFLKIQLILDELWRHPKTAHLLSNPIQILDVGCGPGTNLLGAMEFLHKRFTISAPVRCVGVDALEKNLEDTRFFLDRWVSLRNLGGSREHIERKANLEVGFQTERVDLETAFDLRRLGKFQIVIVANVLNEVFKEEPNSVSKRTSMIARLVDHCLSSEGFLILIEPALKTTSRELLQLRDQLIQNLGLTVYAPCVHNSNCPAIARGNVDDWCHESVPWSRPEIIREIDERIGNRKGSLKFCYVVLGRKGLSVREVSHPSACLKSEDCSWRVVSERLEEAGKISLYLCGSAGRFKVTRLNKHLDQSNEAFSTLDRGKVVATGALSFKSSTDARVQVGTPVTIITAMRDAAN